MRRNHCTSNNASPQVKPRRHSPPKRDGTKERRSMRSPPEGVRMHLFQIGIMPLPANEYCFIFVYVEWFRYSYDRKHKEELATVQKLLIRDLPFQKNEKISLSSLLFLFRKFWIIFLSKNGTFANLLSKVTEPSKKSMRKGKRRIHVWSVAYIECLQKRLSVYYGDTTRSLSGD